MTWGDITGGTRRQIKYRPNKDEIEAFAREIRGHSYICSYSITEYGKLENNQNRVFCSIDSPDQMSHEAIVQALDKALSMYTYL